MRKFTLWQCHLKTFYQNKIGKIDEINVVAAVKKGNMDHDNGIDIEPWHANTNLQQ